MSERERHAQRIAAVEHAAAAAIAEHRRLQHGGNFCDFRGRILGAPAAHDQHALRRAEPLCRVGDGVLVERRFGRRLRRNELHLARAPPHVDGAFERRRTRTSGPHRGHRLRDQRGSLLGAADAGAMADKPRDDAGLVADLVEVAEAAADVRVGDLPDQRQHRRVHRIGHEQRRAGVEQSGAGHDRVGLRLAGGERGAERHIGGALFMAGVDGPDGFGGLEQRIEQGIVVHAGKGIDRVEPMGDERGDGRFGGGHPLHSQAPARTGASRRVCKSPPRCRGPELCASRRIVLTTVIGPSLGRHGRPCAGHPRMPVRRCRFVDARDKPGHDDVNVAPPHWAEASPQGNDMHRYRTHTCGALRERDIGAAVRLSGWVHRIRDHGGLLFIDLRDHYGLTQCVADPDSPAFAAAERLRAESVVRIDGTVRRRPDGTENPELPTGAVEIFIAEIEVLSPAAELPLPVFGEPEYPEDIRLKYRFLDLRRVHLHANIMRRIAVIDSLRARMKAQGFSEFQTPILTASSPEGARDFLVPSRLHPGKFYALPQAPQQFKQLLMVAGFDRYFQIAPCFRDEDPRADRLPGEFYQLDVEMSFVTQDDVFAAMEPVLRGVFEEFAGDWSVTKEFPRISYREAMRKYGTDKPDLRNPLVIADVTEEFAGAGVEFKAFKNKIVRALPAPGAPAQPRSFFDKLNEWARSELAAPGLGYIVFEADGGKGPIAKFIPADVQQKIAAAAGVKPGDAVFFAAGREEEAAKLAGAARTRLGEELGLIDQKRFALAWIVDFPMYEWNDLDKKIDFSHNPFSMPQGGLEALESRSEEH